jgi:hypothetical protein
MSAWVGERLRAAGIHRHGRVRQVRTWGRAALLEVETDRGRFWAKAVPDAFTHEIAVTGLLADVDPGFVPPVVTYESRAGRIITEHVDGPSLAAVDDPEVWGAALGRLAEIQRVLAADVAALEVAGVVAAPLERLADGLPDLLADDDLLLVGRPGGLRRREAEALRGRSSELDAACRALAGLGPSVSLEHGDLAADEVLLGEMGPVFLDWSDGSITHPFLSAAALLGSRRTGRSARDLEDAYLGPWVAARAVSLEDGRQALELARIVLPLHVAALFRDRILPALGQRWELERVVPDALRTIPAG